MTSKDYRDALVGAIFDDPDRPYGSDDKLIITSPNMVVLPYWKVHLKRCAVSLYDDERCGLWDYTLLPQVHHREQGHLPLIICPDMTVPDSPRAMLHHRLDPKCDWSPVSWSNTQHGTIEKTLTDTLHKTVQELLQKYRTLRKEKVEATGNAEAAKDYDSRKGDVRALEFYAGRLQENATFSTSVHVWSVCQRIYLELRAFLDVLTIYRPLLINLPSTPMPVDLDRMGAITREPQVAHDLFMVGLPVYFVRTQGSVDLAKVQRLLSRDEVIKALREPGIVRSGHQPGAPRTKVLFVPKHPKPQPNPLLYVGSPQSVNLPRAIQAWTRKMHPLQTAPLERSAAQKEDMIKYGLVNASQPDTAPPVALAISARTTSDTSTTPAVKASAKSTNKPRRGRGGGPSQQPTTATRGRVRSTHPTEPTAPLSSLPSTATAASSGAASQRNKWATTSSYMPKALEIWEEESRELGKGHSESILPTWPGATPNWRGYILPEAALVAALPETQRSWAVFIIVRVLSELEYLVNRGSEPWRNSDWRRFITIGQAEYAKSLTASGITGYHKKTVTAEQRDRALIFFNQCLNRARSVTSFSLQDLLQPISRRGVHFKHDGVVSQQDTQAVLAHLNEISFRWELANLDGVLFDWDRYGREFAHKAAQTVSENPDLPPPQALSPQARRWAVVQSMSHFEGQFVPDAATFYQQAQGFTSERVEFRVHALRDLGRIMEQWKEPHRLGPQVFEEIERLGGMHIHGLSQSSSAIAVVERKIACHYIQMYKDVFSRAPAIPRSTYWPM